MIFRVIGSDEYRATKDTLERFKVPFAKAGYDINKLRTREQWARAIEASFAIEMHALAAQNRGAERELDAILDCLPGWD